MNVRLLLLLAIAGCAGAGTPPSGSPSPSASAASASAVASASVSVTPISVASSSPAAVVDAGPPADVLCEGRSCRIEKANAGTLADLARSHPDLGDVWILGGRPGTLAPLAPLTKLHRFRIALCEGLTDKDFAFAKGWTELTELEVSNCDNFTSVAPLGSLPRLTDVSLINTSLRSIEWLQGAPLVKLRVQSGVTDLAAIATMTQLTDLSLVDLDGVHAAPFLGKLTHLETLYVEAADFTSLPDLSPLVSLKNLTLSHVPKLTELKGLAALPALTNVSIDWCGITDLAKVGTLDHVAFLHLEGTKVKDLTPLAAWKSLGVVIVADDTSPALLAALKKAKPSLRAITAHQAALAAQGPH